MCVECVSGCGVLYLHAQDDCKREGEGEGGKLLGSREGVVVTLTHTHSPPFTKQKKQHNHPPCYASQINYAAGCRDGDDRSGKSCNISDPIVHITVETW